MADRETVLADLLDVGPRQALPAWKSSRVIPNEGVAYLDCNDPDHTYRLTVTAVTRRHVDAPENDIATIEGIPIRLTSVEMCFVNWMSAV